MALKGLSYAHINLRQIAIAIAGSCTFILDDGRKREEISLNSPSKGLLIEGLIWREMKSFSKDCVLVVLASEPYNKILLYKRYKILDMANER